MPRIINSDDIIKYDKVGLVKDKLNTRLFKPVPKVDTTQLNKITAQQEAIVNLCKHSINLSKDAIAIALRNDKPNKWTFNVDRSDAGVISSVKAQASNGNKWIFQITRDSDLSITEVTVIKT